MTRDSLRHLENRLVVFTGRLADVSRPRGGIRCYLINRVRCWAWDGDSPVSFSVAPDGAADHAWLRIAVDEQPSIELLQRVEGIATIGWYSRADGSVDLGLRSHQMLDLDELLVRFHEARDKVPRTALIQVLQQCLGRLAAPGHYGFSRELRASEVKRTLTTYHERLQRSQAAEERIRATTKPGRRPSGARSFADLLKAA